MMSFRPLSNTIIVELDKEKEVLKSGIIIPHQKVEQPILGTVIAVGPGKKYSNGTIAEASCKPGDRVLFAKFAGSETTLEDKQYIVLQEDDIMAIIEGEVKQ